jgi:flagellar basal body P-ring formation protein FlgA
MILSLLLALTVSDVTVTLPEATTVAGMELTVAAVADVKSDDSALATRIGELSLGYAPAPGYSRLLQAARMHTQLVRAFPEATIQFVGSASVRVTPETTRVTVNDLRAEALRALRTHGGSADLEVKPRGALSDLEVPRAVESLSLHARLKDPILRSGNLNVPVEIIIDGEVWRTVWTAWQAGVFAQRPVLKVAVPRGTVISAALVEFKRIEVTARPAVGVLQPKDLAHMQTTRDLAAGQVVTESDVQRMVILKRGDMVSLVVKKGRIEARSMATALEAGRIGDRVRVQVKSSGREVWATLVAKDRLEIVLR